MTTSYNVKPTFDWIERINAAQTLDQLIAELANAAAEFGFKATAIAAFPHPNIPFEKRVIARHWPDGWFEHYMANNYIAADPVFRHSRTALRPFEWSEAPFEKNSKAAQVMSEAAEFGFSAGFCVPTQTSTGPINVTFGGERSEMSREDRGMLHLLAIYAQIRATELLTGKLDGLAEVLKLSPRELEVLQWCAEGKTSEKIAEALGISSHTVLTHIGGACRKLGARSRTAAVAKAIHAGLIKLAP
jgi:LuxR family quorum sensing-dependent transcriptional regulator